MTEKIRNLLVRAASGVVLLGVVLGAAFMGPLGYSALLLLITGVGVWEFYALARAKGVEPQRGLGLVGSLGLTLTGASILCVNYLDYYYEVFILLGIAIAALAIMFTFVVEVFRNRQTPIHNIATTILGIVYVGLPLAVMAIIPMLLDNNLDFKCPEWNPWVFLCYLFLVWGNDVFAYLVGISIGKHKMCERLSPKKSWEGFFGGVIGSLAMGALGAYIVEGNYIMWIGLALVVSLSSVVGDLAESMFKRDAGVKDSGAFIPGHGGMLDRFDALIFSAPFAFLYLIIANIFLTA
ncbi:MAG: phosphatidate cytidylyltransferase [Alistipes sp.]|nr:phosphatidate cytidylyltransferase [Alistipes sp.]